MIPDFTFFEARFETASDIPPPFCYYYQLICELKNGKWLADFMWKYHNREGFMLEELEDEGFTGQDDFEWQGEIPATLIKAISDNLANLHFLHEENLAENENYLFLALKQNQQELSGMPQPHENLEYILQEVIQGIYEISGKEAPLQIGLLKNDSSFSQKIQLTVSFAQRSAFVEIFENKLPTSKKTYEDWTEIHSLIGKIFNMDFNPEKSQKKQPSASGYFVNTGDGMWYETKNWEKFVNKTFTQK
jgi:hypothetical protein